MNILQGQFYNSNNKFTGLDVCENLRIVLVLVCCKEGTYLRYM